MPAAKRRVLNMLALPKASMALLASKPENAQVNLCTRACPCAAVEYVPIGLPDHTSHMLYLM